MNEPCNSAKYIQVVIRAFAARAHITLAKMLSNYLSKVVHTHRAR